MNTVRDSIEKLISNHPEIGLGGTATGVGISFIETITDVAQMISAIIGVIIGAYTLVAIRKRHLKNKNEGK